MVQSQAGFDIFDARFGHALAFARGVVPRVFAQVALLAGFLDGLNDGRTFAFEAGQLFFQPFVALHGNRDTRHCHVKPRKRKKSAAAQAAERALKKFWSFGGKSGRSATTAAALTGPQTGSGTVTVFLPYASEAKGSSPESGLHSCAATALRIC